jgi:glutamate dehydrogenase
VILTDFNHQDHPTIAFEKYIDSLLDLILPQQSGNSIVDLHGQEEILFMGPDENTAGLVDWATEHAKIRGAKWWKSFFTGKSMELGGIPHDRFGMTTRGVRAFVEGIYEKLGLKQEDVTKIQTGGPDGDLGSSTSFFSPC